MPEPWSMRLLQAAVGPIDDTRRFGVAHIGSHEVSFALFGGAPGFTGHRHVKVGEVASVGGYEIAVLGTGTDEASGRPFVDVEVCYPEDA